MRETGRFAPGPASGLAEGTAAGEVTLVAECWK